MYEYNWTNLSFHHGLQNCKILKIPSANWRDLVQIATLQMIGHALLNTNFNTLKLHLKT